MTPPAENLDLKQEYSDAFTDRKLLSVLLRVARDMNSEKDVDRLLEYIPGVVAEMTDSERCTIFLLDREADELWSRVATEAEEVIRVKVGAGIAGHVAATGESLNIRDAYNDPRFSGEVDRLTGFTTRSLLSTPMKNLQGDIIGVFQLLNKRTGEFSDQDEEFMSLFGSHAAVAIEGARLNRENRRAIRQLEEAQKQLQEQMRLLEMLYSIEQEINRSTDFERILSSVITLSAKALGAEAASILLSESEGAAGRLYFQYSYGEKSEELRRFSIPREEGFAGWVLKEMRPLLSNDPLRDARFNRSFADQLEFPVRNMMATPLTSGGKLLGVLEVLNRRDRGFEERDFSTLEFIGSQISGTLQRKLLFEESQRAQRLASVGNMASRVIHDFKNPMTVIKGITQLFQEGDLPPEKRDKYAKMMLGEVDRCVEMTQEILDYARGDVNFRLCQTRVDHLLEEVLPLLESDCVQRGVPLRTDIQPDLVIQADPSKLKRVFFNICRNSLEALRGLPGEISVAAKRIGGAVEFRLADTGPGIAPEIRETIFEPFATHGKPSGTGLGLAICKSVVEGHGGSIAIDPAHSPGACFVITLPAPE